MFFNRFNRGKKPLTSPDIIKKIGFIKKKGLTGLARRYALPLGALLVLVSFVLTAVIEPAKAGTYTRMPSGAAVVAGKITGTPASDMDSDNAIYTIFKDNTGNFKMEADITLDTFSADASKIYKAVLTIDAFVNKGYDGKNYYVKMFTGPLATDHQDFDAAGLGPFTTTDGSSDTVTLTENNIAKAQAFYNAGAPKVKLMNALSYNGTADTLASELSVDYLDVTFYEDINQPVTGSLTPASNSSLSGIIPITLANVQDNASAAESGMEDVFFEYSSDQVNWYPISTDITPDVGNNYSVNWDTSALYGSYAIRAKARDKVGNITEVTSTNIMLGSDTTPPVNVYIQSPANFKRVNNPTIIAHAEDNVGITKVEFYSQANPLVPFGIDTDSVGGWTYVWDTSNQINYVENNSYWVKVKAYDAAGFSTTSIENYYNIDRTAPMVSNSDPANNNQSVATNRPPIKATFDGPMDQSTFIANNTFKLIQEDNQAIIPGQITGYDPAAYTVTFTPDVDLPAEKWFVPTLTSGVKDEAGNSLLEYSWRFKTTDTSSPIVTAINPPDTTSLKREQIVITANASDNVEVTKVEFYWSEAVSGPWYIIGTPDTTIADGWTSTLNTADLPHDGNYYIKALAYDAKYPQNPPGEKVVSYNIDKTLPQVLPFSLSPVDGAVKVTINPTIKATFSEAMTEGTVNSTNIYLTRFGSLEVILTTLSFDPVSKTVTLTLPANTVLDYNTQYSAHITTGVTDLRGNLLEGPLTWSFTTVADLLSPDIIIQGVSPKTISPQNADGQNDSALVSFSLSEKASVCLEVYDSVGIKVYQSPTVNFYDGGALTNLGMRWVGKNDAGGFVPDSNYTLYLRAQDTAGNSTRALVPDQVTVDNQGPYITQVVPESRTKVIISFNEPMDANTAQHLSFNTVIKETYNPVSLNPINFTRLDSMNFTVESVYKQRTDRTWYSLIINNIFDQVGNSINNHSTFDFTGFNPHGLYGSKTSLCSSCHLTHSSLGTQLINSTKVKLLCYVCHNGGGQSTYNNVKNELTPKTDSNPSATNISYHPVEAEKTPEVGMISCEDCHNVHGDEVTSGSGSLYKKLLRAKKIVKNPVTNEVYFTGEIFNQGNGYCWACHGVNSPYPGGDKETYYPAAHSGNEWEMNEPESKAKIRCSKCHLHHGSSRRKLIPPTVTFRDLVTQQVNTVSLPDVGECVCCTCHKENPGIASNINYNGRLIYGSNTPHGSSKKCTDCHDPHSEKITKLLKQTFLNEPKKEDVNGTTYYSGDYSPNNYQTCFGCHATKLTQKSKDIDIIPTKFWNDALWNAENYNNKTNLHDYHLNLKNYQPGFGNVTCRECHRVHGSLPEENPDGIGRPKSQLVGFPLRGTVATQAYEYPQPVWKVILNVGSQPAGGTCNLVCHGKTHDDVTYLAGQAPPPSVSKDASCYNNGCHEKRQTPDYNDIESLMGEGTIPGENSFTRHIVTNVAADEAGGNGCLTECHTTHTFFENPLNGAARNTREMVWTVDQGTGVKTQSQDERLCLNKCHIPSSLDPNAPPPLSPNFTSTAHSYEPSTPYHDYDAPTTQGVFKANCLKCHMPHGSDNFDLLSFTNRTNSFGRDVSSITNLGRDNSVCLSCHTRPTSPGWPGNTIYIHSSNAHGTKNLTGTDPDVGYCSSCHDVHGKDDGSGLIPELLKVRGTASCYVCHNDTPIPNSAMPDWAGSTKYNLGAHSNVANSFQTGYCGICHAVHGSDDGTGKPFAELLTAKEEASCWGPNGSTACHSSNLGTPARNNVQSLYSRTFKHGDPVNQSGNHNSTERSFLPNNRHAECEDCHNSHSAKLTSGAKGTNVVKPSEENVWGINPVETWPTPAAGTLAAPTNWSIVENSQYEWQICLKCHSKWAYGNSPPPSTTWSGAITTQTDSAAEFNPNNYGHHAVIVKGNNQPGGLNPSFSSSFVNGWTANSTVACSDCHSSDNSAEARGTHGSNFRYILVKNANGGANFCSNCHNPSVYGDPTLNPAVSPTLAGSRWNHGQNYSAHSSSTHISGIWCLNCHMGDGIGGSHGSNKGPGASIDTRGGYTSAGNLPLGKRLMNGSNIISYNTKTGGIACWAAASPLSSCSKSHAPANVTPNYDYTGP